MTYTKYRFVLLTEYHIHTQMSITSLSWLFYVSSGIGLTQYPFRFGNIPEIIEVSLTDIP